MPFGVTRRGAETRLRQFRTKGTRACWIRYRTCWVSNFTYVATRRGFAHVAFVIYAHVHGPRRLALDAFAQAVHDRRPVEGMGLFITRERIGVPLHPHQRATRGKPGCPAPKLKQASRNSGSHGRATSRRQPPASPAGSVSAGGGRRTTLCVRLHENLPRGHRTAVPAGAFVGSTDQTACHAASIVLLTAKPVVQGSLGSIPIEA